MSLAAAQANLAKAFDVACKGDGPLIITRKDGPPVVLLSLDEYRAHTETAYLLRTPGNARRLLSAVSQLSPSRDLR